MGWIEQWYALVAERRRTSAGDLLFDEVDDRFLAGQFAEVDTFLTDVDLERLDTYAIVGVLAITFAARDKLEEREAFVARARKRLEELAPDRVDRLMEGLE